MGKTSGRTGKRALPRPTHAELALLRGLWARGPQTVRDVLEALESEREVGYTTVLKQLQIMLDKGLVRRREDGRSHVYEAAIPREATERGLVGDLVRHVFGGSSARLVLSALAEEPASLAEIAQIRALLDGIEGKGGKR